MATPTTFTNQATWFANTYPELDWKELSSGKRERYRTEYKSWVESLNGTPATEATPTTGSPTGGYGYSNPEWAALAGNWDPSNPVYAEGYDPSQGMGDVQQLINPETGLPYTFEEIASHPGGVGATGGGVGTPVTTPVTPGGAVPGTTTPGVNVSGLPALPPYTPSAELTALAGQVGGAISDILEQGGLGIGEEIKEDLFLREAEMINASNAQSIKNMKDEMARRGMSNSGQVFSETMKLNSKADIQMANVMRDVEIADAYMKLASYENAIGMGVQFLSYLSEESWRQYQPILYQWQAQIDMYKMAINQAYTVGNMRLAQKYAMQMAQFEADTATQLTQMQIDAASKAADKKTFWDILGTGLGFLAAIFL